MDQKASFPHFDLTIMTKLIYYNSLHPEEERPQPSPGSKGSNSSKAKARPPVKPDKYLAKLESEYRAEELKARIRAAKMMSQGVTYSQVVGGPVVPPQGSVNKNASSCLL
jgi:hypothetical protein